MKKIIAFILVMILSLALLCSCSLISNMTNPDSGSSDSDDNDQQNQDNNDNDDGDSSGGKKPGHGNTDGEYLYIAFTNEEKALFNEITGATVPFIPTNEYYVERYYDSTVGEECVSYYTIGNTQSDFIDYLDKLTGYEFVDSYQDEDGDEWYCYSGANYIEMSFYYYDGDYVIDLYVYAKILNVEDGNDGDNGNDNTGYNYVGFTPNEMAQIIGIVGEVIPFVPNNQYYIEEYTFEYEDCYEVGFNFYTIGNTQADFNAYKALFSGYTFDGSEQDEYGDWWYFYSSDKYGYCVDISYYDSDYGYIIDVYAYCLYDYDDGNGGNSGGTDNGGDTYTDFTSSEKNMFIEMFGEVIPFAPNSEYYVEEYSYEYDDCYEVGLNFYTYGNTQSEFNTYKALFSKYSYDGSDVDEYGDAWYYYTTSYGAYIDMSYYETDKGYVIDVYVYFLYDYEDGNGGGGNGGSSSTTDLITNAGAGLPTGTNGVYDVDFTDGKYVQDVTDQGYYLDGCPTTGSPAVLVIPVDFKDINGRNSSYYSIENIVRAFNGGSGSTDYYSVHDYYYISSYGKLDLDITVLDQWFVPSNTSSYYAKATMDYYGDNVAIGDQMVLDEALAYLSTFMDLSKYDTDGNGIIDAVVLVTTLDIDPDTDFYWAYRYWNIYTDNDGYYYEYDGVSANDYIWVPYSFMHESYDSLDNAIYTDTSVMNTYTFIHEFGHILGADDYYNTASFGEHPMDGCDVMDAMPGDHNAFTKFNLGWLTGTRLVTTNGSVTLTLEAFAKNGDTIIIANNFDPTLGAYQEYYIVVYYTSEDLNGGDYGYFINDGIIVYHVNASLYSEEYDDEIYYDIYNNNTDASDYYGTEDNLIEFVKSQAGNFVYGKGDKLPSVTDDQGNKLSYSFVVDSINGDYATITFTKN